MGFRETHAKVFFSVKFPIIYRIRKLFYVHFVNGDLPFIEFESYNVKLL